MKHWKKALAIGAALACLLMSGCYAEPGANATYYNTFLGVSVFVPPDAKLETLVDENVVVTDEPMAFADFKLADDGATLDMLQMSKLYGFQQSFDYTAWVHVFGFVKEGMENGVSSVADEMRVPSGEREGILFDLAFDGLDEIDGRTFHRFTYVMTMDQFANPLEYEILITEGLEPNSFILVETSMGGYPEVKELALTLRENVTYLSK